MKRSGKILLQGTIEEFRKHCKGADNREYLLINSEEIRSDGSYSIYKLDGQSERIIPISITGKYNELNTGLLLLYLSFKILESGTLYYNRPYNAPADYVWYSKNNGIWKPLGNSSNSIQVSKGDIIRIKGNWASQSYSLSYSVNASYYFGGSAAFNIYGNILSLLYEDDFVNYDTIDSASLGIFCNLFNGARCKSAERLLLPKNITRYGCFGMFARSLIVVPPAILPAMVLNEYCYASMFSNCESLIKTPLLPATELASYCYDSMFSSCTSLEKPCKLPATTLANYCYFFMFFGCTSLKKAPLLPATTLATYCYNLMFGKCTSMTNFPELPATTLAEGCYYNMFYNCISMRGIPELNFENAPSMAISSMFTGCKNIKLIRLKTSANISSSIGAQQDYTSQSFIVRPLENRSVDSALLPNGWNAVSEGYESDYLTFTIQNKGTIRFNSSSINNTILYSLNKSLWSEENTYINIKVEEGDEIRMKGSMIPTNTGIGTFENSTASFNIKGNVMSLIYGDYFIWETNLLNKENIFKGLFKNTSVISASNLILPSAILSSGCYQSMFQNCVLLVGAPELIALRLAPYCYSLMFEGCVSLVTAPDLNARIMAENCYSSMFKGCINLNYIRIFATDITASNCLNDWTSGVSNSGTLEKNDTEITTGKDGIPDGWTTKVVDFSQEYLTLVAKSNGTFNFKESVSGNLISYSTDNGQSWSEPAATVELDVNIGDKVLWKCNNPSTNTTLGMGSFLDSTAYYNVEGNIMSLLYGDNFVNQTSLNSKTSTFRMLFSYSYITQACNLILPAQTLTSDCCRSMFFACTSLKVAPELPATLLAANCYYSMFFNTGIEIAPDLKALTVLSKSYYNMFRKSNISSASLIDATQLAGNCYEYMFSGCIKLKLAPTLPATSMASNCYTNMFSLSGLTVPPVLPSTSLADYCYKEMFSSCPCLTVAPQLPATTMKKYCYSNMFYGCTSLVQVPELPATTLALNCYASMFSGCTSLTAPPQLPATTLASYCYSSMFSGCTSLATAPELSATTLVSGCYNYMFRDCASLTIAPELPATTLADYCYAYMFDQCVSLEQAPELPATTLASYCYDSMFQGCILLTTAPQLPATTLTSSCYRYMFKGCTNLNYIKMLATDISASNCLYNWVNVVASSGTFVKSSSMTTLPSGINGIPFGWTVEDATE